MFTHKHSSHQIIIIILYDCRATNQLMRGRKKLPGGVSNPRNLTAPDRPIRVQAGRQFGLYVKLITNK